MTSGMATSTAVRTRRSGCGLAGARPSADEERARLIEALTPLATGAGDPVTSAEVVAALVALEADGAIELALTALRDPRREVRHIVAGQLAPTGDRRVVDALVELLDDADGFVREAATIGLQSQADPAALGPLRAMLRREREDRAAKAGAKRAIRALEKSGRRDAAFVHACR